MGFNSGFKGLNAKVGKKEPYLYPASGGHSLHNKTNGKIFTGKKFNSDGKIVST